MGLTKFNGIYSKKNLPETKEGAYVINLDEYKLLGTHWIASHVIDNNETNFGNFGVEHIPKKF